MASNLSTIGFGYATEQQLLAAIGPLVEGATQRLAVTPGDYGIWRSRTGVELWFHIEGERTADGEILDGTAVGLAPFFAGESEVVLRVENVVRRPGDTAFEGAFYAWVLPTADDASVADEAPELMGVYPLVFNAVDFAAHAARPMPLQASARLTGFAHEIAIYPDVAAFEAERSGEVQFAPQSFLPLGLFDAAPVAAGQTALPSSNALVNGIVRDHRRFINEASGQAFVWLLVATYGATLDVVVDPTLLPAGEPEDGAIVSATCLMFGRLL